MFRSNVLWLQQQNVCGALLDMIPLIRFKNNEKYRLFLLTLVTDDTYSFETPVLSQNLKTYEKIKYPCPSYLKNLVRGRRAAKISEQHESLEQKRKN